MTPWRTALTLAALALLGAPASAQAADEYPTVAQALAVADAYWGDHPCARRVRAVSDPTLLARSRQGEASGMKLVNGEWLVARCEIAYASEMDADPAGRCLTIVHEVGHLVQGAEHVGRLAPDFLFQNAPAGCLPSPRRTVMNDIREYLPKGLAWRIACGPNAKRMRCRATSRSARHARLFTASIVDDWVDVAPVRLGRR